MTMRPEDIKNRTFANALRGYDKDEVRSFLFKVAESSRELHEQLAATETQLASVAVEESGHDTAADLDRSDGTAVAGGAFDADVSETPEGFAAEAGSFDANLENIASGNEIPAYEAETFAVESVDSAFVVPVGDEAVLADEPVTAPDAFVEAPVESLAAAERSIADRYGAIGDRIADLLRNADESAADILARAKNDSEGMRAAAEAEAAQVRLDAEAHASQLLAEAETVRAEADAYRDEVMAELANARLEQETALQEARANAEAEVETYRVDSIAEITALRSDAFVEIDELRSEATTEVAELRSVTEVETEAMRTSVLAEATASIADDEAEAARLLGEAEADRAAARAELDDVRSEVNSLLEQARTQSEFIKQEADEIIRTKVRANFEQAQTRIDVLRNTEVASRERIVLAQTELASALTRLDSEPMPELDPTDSPAVIQEAVARHGELSAPSETFEVGAYEGDVVDDAVADAGLIEADVFEDQAIEDEAIEDEAIEDEIVDDETFEADESETDDVESDASEQGSLSNYFGPGADDETTGDILASSLADPVDAEPIDSGWPTTEVSNVEYDEIEPVEREAVGEPIPLAEAPEFEAPEQSTGTFAAFEVTEHVVVESADYGDLPVRGSGMDLPVRGESEPEVETYVAPEAFGAASLSEALPVDDAPELGGAAQEDALARLVREAMQEAVDSARKND